MCMSIKLKIKEIAEKLGIENANQLRDRTGLGVSTCYQLWEGTAQGIQFDTLNTLCNVLQVSPVLLFEYMPDIQSGSPSDSSRKRSAVINRSKKTARVKRQ